MSVVNHYVSNYLSEEQVEFHKETPLRTPVSVANFWKFISAKSAKKFGRWRKNSAAPIIL
jgi:hypothetical protein